MLFSTVIKLGRFRFNRNRPLWKIPYSSSFVPPPPPPQLLHKHCFLFLLELTMVPRENKNNAYAKFGGTNKEYYGIFRNGHVRYTYQYSNMAARLSIPKRDLVTKKTTPNLEVCVESLGAMLEY